IYARMKEGGEVEAPVADWETKRRWVDEAFTAFRGAGYMQSSAYTVYRPNPAATEAGAGFLYRDALWHGADMLGLGVSSFSHLGGVHFQHDAAFGSYLESVERGELPISRAYALNDDQRLIREFILQLKTGAVRAGEFTAKFGVDPR